MEIFCPGVTEPPWEGRQDRHLEGGWGGWLRGMWRGSYTIHQAVCSSSPWFSFTLRDTTSQGKSLTLHKKHNFACLCHSIVSWWKGAGWRAGPWDFAWVVSGKWLLLTALGPVQTVYKKTSSEAPSLLPGDSTPHISVNVLYVFPYFKQVRQRYVLTRVWNFPDFFAREALSLSLHYCCVSSEIPLQSLALLIDNCKFTLLCKVVFYIIFIVYKQT